METYSQILRNMEKKLAEAEVGREEAQKEAQELKMRFLKLIEGKGGAAAAAGAYRR